MKFVEDSMLSLDAIVVPTRAAEIDHIRRNLTLWSSPHFAPTLSNSHTRPLLHFVFNNEDAKCFEEEIAEAFARNSLDRHFGGLSFTFLGLSGLDDLYARKELGPVGPGGYKAGPNNQFFRTMELYMEAKSAIFYMETDCVPIRAGWIGAIENVLRQHQYAFVVGSTYRGGGKLQADIFRHVNGNALYCVGQDGFDVFLAEWKKWLLRLIATRSKSMAYDVLVETVFSLAPGDEEANNFYLNYVGRIQYSNFVQNISAPLDAFLTDPEVVKLVRERYDDTYMMHGAMFARAVQTLIESGKPLEPDNLLVEVETDPVRLLALKRDTALGNAKRWVAGGMRDFADFLDHNNVKHALLRKLSGRR